MATKNLESRLAALETGMEKLQEQVEELANDEPHWWRDRTGRFANDPA